MYSLATLNCKHINFVKNHNKFKILQTYNCFKARQLKGDQLIRTQKRGLPY